MCLMTIPCCCSLTFIAMEHILCLVCGVIWHPSPLADDAVPSLMVLIHDIENSFVFSVAVCSYLPHLYTK